jgi:hypothetical protein
LRFAIVFGERFEQKRADATRPQKLENTANRKPTI